VHRRVDIANLEALKRELEGCDLVFHLAAVADASRAAAEPLACFAVNAQGAANVMEACRLSGAKVIYTSTAHVYGAPLANPVNEDHPANPASFYAASKLAGEAAVAGYAASFGLTAVIARLSNLYGGDRNTNTVIGIALDAIAAGLPVRLRSLDEVRDFLYIDDATEGLVRLAQTAAAAGGLTTVNLSAGVGSRISQVVSELARAAVELGLPEPSVAPASGTPDPKVPRLVLDNRRLREITGWMPSTSLRQGLLRALRERLGMPLL
jgi:dTDP-glucose 4,6-dehydratase